MGPGKPLDFLDYAKPIQTRSREGDALMAQGRHDEASKKYIQAANLCVEAANVFAAYPEYKATLIDRQRALKAQAQAALSPSAQPPRQNVPERTASAPAPQTPAPPSKKPLVNSALTEGITPFVKRPTSVFEFDRADYLACGKYVAEVTNLAESIKGKDPQRAIGLFTEAAELLEYWGVQRFNSLGDEARTTMRSQGQKFAAAAQRLREGNPPAAAAAAAAVGTGSGKTDLSEIEQRARGCIRDPDKAARWDDVIGCGDAKTALLTSLVDDHLVVSNHKARKKGTGVLLYGPSGTGKTMIVEASVTLAAEVLSKRRKARKAVEQEGEAKEEASGDPAKGAKEAKPAESAKREGITLLIASMADVNSKWVGEAEKFVRALFDVARKEAPSVIFIDEVDALFAQRTADQNQASRAAINEFLIQSNSLTKEGTDVKLVCATNMPWLLDDAIRQRISSQVEVPLPDPKTRGIILKQKIKKLDYPCTATDAEIEALAASPLMNNFSGRNLETVATNAMAGGPQRRKHESAYYVERQGVTWPCDADTEGGRKISYVELLCENRDTELAFGEPPITVDDIKNACRGVPTADSQIATFAAYRKKVEAARQ